MKFLARKDKKDANTQTYIAIEDLEVSRPQGREGRLFGATPAEAFFVRCDMTTMTQADLDDGRLICVIGVARLEPAEFVIFRIGQYTASSSSS